MNMISIIIQPDDTKEGIAKIINHQTRFAIVPDDFPGNPTGYGVKDHSSHWLVDMIKQFPDCTFILAARVAGIENLNVVMLPLTCLKEVFLNDWTYNVDWSQRSFTCSIIGGKTRINRTMASFWLAKNYPAEQLKYHYTENNDIQAIEKYITSAKYFRPRKFLLDTWLSVDMKNVEIAFNHLLPNIISQAYINLGVESVNPVIESRITEKTLQAWLGGTMFLPLGEHQKDKEITRYGFESFSDVFDFRCSNSHKHFELTVGVLEDNKNFILDHSAVEQAWHDNLPKIKHNQRLAADRGHWQRIQHRQLSVLSDAVKLLDFSQIPRVWHWLKFFIQ